MGEGHGSPKFTPGQQVKLRSERDLIGVVLDELKCIAGEYWYRVKFGNSNPQRHPESNLEVYEGSNNIDDLLINGSFGSKETLSKLITFTKIHSPIQKNVYSFTSSRAEFLGYQFKPVLKFIDSHNQRLLIADEVGLGKTIEAGYILKEQKARHNIDRVLVVCRATVIEKWKLEMESKFQEDFDILKASNIREFLRKQDERGDPITLRGICSLETLRSSGLLEEWEAASPPLDLVIMDEAHHLRNPETRSHKLGLILSENTDGMLMLTATPVHLGNQDLFYLLRILSSDEFDNYQVFKQRLLVNQHILMALSILRNTPPDLNSVKSTLERVKYSEHGEWFKNNPIYSDVLERLSTVDTNNREQIITLQHDINALNLLGHIVTRTRKRDVQVKAKRVPNIIHCNFTHDEAEFYNAVTNYVIAKYSSKGLGVFGKFIAIMPQRQVASCIPAMVEYYEQMFSVNFGGIEAEVSDIDIEDYGESIKKPDNLDTPEYYALLDLIENKKLKGVDSKLDALLDTLHQIDEAEPHRQIIIFSYFKKTLNYLSKKLNALGYKNIVISGDYSREERNQNIENFRNDTQIKVMLTSEVGSEGLDFQFCHIMINYDLPWNPMVVEQRIGRLDRIGQKSDRILIFNFSIPGTIEDKILRRLYNRIKIFEESIGDLEDILGEEVRELTRDLLTSKLSQEEQEERIIQTADVLIQNAQIMTRLESESAKFIGNDEFFDDEIDRIKKHKRFITSDELRVFISEFLQKKYPRCSLTPLVGNKRFSLTVDNDLIRFMKDNLPDGDLGFRSIINRVARNQPAFTFDAEEAFSEPKLDFINLDHPLIRSIKAYYEKNQKELHPVARINLKNINFPEGYYLYFIYLLDIKGARPHRSLEPIFVSLNTSRVLEQELGEDILSAMTTEGETLDQGEVPDIPRERIQKFLELAEEELVKRIMELKSEIGRINNALINTRLASLEQSFDVKCQKKMQLLERARAREDAPQYIRMLEGGLRNIKLDHELKVGELEKARDVHESFIQVGAGIVRIHNA